MIWLFIEMAEKVGFLTRGKFMNERNAYEEG